jgi:hypothetical protein
VPEEFDSWAPELQVSIETTVESNAVDGNVSIWISSNAGDHPIWLKLSDGKLVEALIGSRNLDEVIGFIRMDSEPAGH